MLHPCYVHIYTSFMATRYTSEQSPTTFPGRVGSPSTKLVKNAEPRSPTRPLNHSRREKNRETADCVRNCDEYGQWRETDLSKMVHSQKIPQFGHLFALFRLFERHSSHGDLDPLFCAQPMPLDGKNLSAC
ncbi:hypothetical protein SRHO_G00095390 [Serrasalmus rhombeus]